MKYATRFTVCLVFLLYGCFSFAQIRFGVKAGANYSNIHSDFVPFDPLPGWQAGGFADVLLSSRFSIQPALQVIGKGFSSEIDYRDKVGNSVGRFDDTYRILYAELPVLLLYKRKVSETTRLFAGAGPYLGVALGGKMKSDHIEDQKLTFTSSTGNYIYKYHRMDYGAAGTVG